MPVKYGSKDRKDSRIESSTRNSNSSNVRPVRPVRPPPVRPPPSRPPPSRPHPSRRRRSSNQVATNRNLHQLMSEQDKSTRTLKKLIQQRRNMNTKRNISGLGSLKARKSIRSRSLNNASRKNQVPMLSESYQELFRHEMKGDSTTPNLETPSKVIQPNVVVKLPVPIDENNTLEYVYQKMTGRQDLHKRPPRHKKRTRGKPGKP